MPQKVHAAGCVLNSLSYQKYCGLWITDSLLAETWHAFCFPLRRHGSNVPGPLEARRRASKRKNTNLAYVGSAGQVTYDPAVIFGNAPQNKWWNNPVQKLLIDAGTQGYLIVEQSEAVKDMPYPFCWQRPQETQTPSTTASATTRIDMEISTETSHFSSMKGVESEFKKHIREARNLESLRAIINAQELNLRLHPTLCQYAFEHLMKYHSQKASYHKFGEALYDPILNPPGSNNSFILFQHLCSSKISRYQFDILFPAFIKALQLGLVPPESLEKIILLLPKIFNMMSIGRGTDKLYAEWHHILSAVEQSTVIHLNDLDSGFLSSWYQQIAGSTQTDATCILMWRLRQYSGLADIDLALDLVMSRLKIFAEIDSGASEKLVKLLASFPVELQGPVIVRGTFKLIADAQGDESLSHTILEKWSLMLPQLYSDKLRQLSINNSTWAQAATDAHGLTSSQQILTIIWVVTRLWATRPEAATRFADMNIRDKFEDIFFNTGGVYEFDNVSRIVSTLDTLPLPNKDHIFPILQHFSSHSLIEMLVDKDYVNGLTACLKLDYSQTQDNAFDFKARHGFPQLLRVLAESANKDLRQFQAMAQILILKSRHNFRIVRRLLEYNLEMKFTVSQSWPTRIAQRKIEDIGSGLDPAAVLEMLEKLTMTFAVTLANEPRSSFRHVYRMYIFLHKWGAPINPIIGRALWHSGVTRYGQAGAPKAQVLWCLAKVRAIEGEEVANRLLWSPGFRNTFVQEFLHSLRDTAILPGLPESLGQATKLPQGPSKPIQPEGKVVREKKFVEQMCCRRPGKIKLKKKDAKDEI